MQNKTDLSIIIVHYKVEKEIIECINSIIESKPNISYEVIIVDNDENKTLMSKINKKFPRVIYIKSPKNLGYGAGNNLGTSYARGKFFFFLNPDTKISAGKLDKLVSILKNNKNTGIVAPLLLNGKGIPYQQGSGELGPLQGIICLSFINKFFPSNPVSRDYFLSDWDRKTIKEVDVVPGTAFMISRELFERIGEFDNIFFLFFEEFDLCKRVKKLGYKIYITPDCKITHIWGASVDQINDIGKIFRKSRFYYFRKHFGLFNAAIVNIFLDLSKEHLFLCFILLISLFLSTYRLRETMPFIGDQGWFFLSARDMLLTGKIPLVGIESSHPWIHQGPIWTYMLVLPMSMFKFEPVSGGYLGSLIGVATVYLMYLIGRKLFSKNIGLIASLLYAFSPIIIMHSRFPYHTNPIPFFTVLFLFAFASWIKGNINYFPFIIFLLGVLYNLEIATFVFAIIIVLVIVWGFFRNKKWAIGLINKKSISLTIIGFLIPMLPFLLHDVKNGFPQTVKFIAWIGYKTLTLFGYSNLNIQNTTPNINPLVLFLSENLQKLIFFPSRLISIFIFFICLTIFVANLFDRIKLHKTTREYIALLLVFIFPLLGFFIAKTPSDAYLPMFFPSVIFLISIGFVRLYEKKFLSLIVALGICIVLFGNILFYVNRFNADMKSGFTLKDRIKTSKQIIAIAKDKQYNLVGKGSGSEFSSFTNNYEYLTWWLGHGPSKENQKIKIFIEESVKGIRIEKMLTYD